MIRLDKVFIWKGALRVLIQGFHVRMGRCIVEKKVIFLDILCMVPLSIRQSKKSLFQNWIGLVPECKSKTHLSLIITNTQQSIFTPTVGTRASVVMWQVIPGVTVGGIIFTHSTPLALTKIRSPAIPRLCIL